MAQKQMTQEDIKKLQAMTNSKFMALSYEQPIKANAQGGNQFMPGTTLNYQVPFISGGWATRITLKYKIELEIQKNSGSVDWNAAAPANLISNCSVILGNKVHSFNPYISNILDLMEGYSRGGQNESRGYTDPEIDKMLNNVPKEIQDGKNEIVVEYSFDLNQHNQQDVRGILPLFSTGTPLQIALSTTTSVVGNDPLDNVVHVTGDAKVINTTGTIDVIVHYRDHNSMTTTESIQPVLDNLETIQTIQIPTLSPLTAGVYNSLEIKSPYKHVKTISFLIDGTSPKYFSKSSNLKGFSINKAGNDSSYFVRYDETTGGVEGLFKETRQTFGQDLPGGVIAFDSTTKNVENVSSKRGVAALDLSAYPAGRFQYKVGEVGSLCTPRVVTHSVIINEGGLGR